MTEPTTPAGRDLLERTASAASTLNDILRDRGIEGYDLRDWAHHQAEVLAIEEQARAEGRREAVRLRGAAQNVIRWWDAAPPTFPEGEYVGPAIEGLRAALDDVARHGRSSDPEPADSVERRLCLCADWHPAHDENNDPVWCRHLRGAECDCQSFPGTGYPHRDFCRYALPDPALQATGEGETP